MKRSLSLFAAAAALALTATAQSQADPFNYTYNWSATPVAIGAGNSGVSLTNNNSNASGVATDTPATNLTVFSAASDTMPDSIPVPAGGSNYTLSVTLTDNQGTGTGTVSFTGLLQGTVSHDSSNLTNAITGSTDALGTHAGQTFGTATFDGTTYTVSYSGFAGPGPESTHAAGNPVGAITFHIDPVPTINQGSAPEPSSMVLGCLGLSFLGGVVLRARRRKVEMLKAAF